MINKPSKLDFPWDSYSDQPHALKSKDKKALRQGHTVEFLKLLFINIIYFPYLFIKFLFKSKDENVVNSVDRSFYGLCVNLDKGDIQQDLVEELGVKSLQVRVFLDDIKNIDRYVEFVKSFGDDKKILITVIQSRKHIENKKLLQKDIAIVFNKFQDITKEFMIGNAINRIKWGFISVEEYLDFFKTIQSVRDEEFLEIKLIGSSVIDFEYHFTIATLYSSFKVYFDKVSSLLYVDRRGSGKNTQYGMFDLTNKIEFLDTIVKNSKNCDNSIYITETNWPLSGTAPYAPTSEKECVNEEEYTRYMVEYFDITKQTGKIEKVYWHQLIAPGYGLVDNRGEHIRKMPQFYAFKKMIEDATN
jgi:coenzyme F420-reducing hydrogenase delta subunit